MNDEKDMDVGEEKDVGPGPAQEVPGHDAAAAAAEAGADAGGGANSPPEAAVYAGGDARAGNPEHGGPKGYIADHKLLLGLCIGALAVMVIVGVFAAGYLVGRPCDGHAGGDLPLRSQPVIPDQRPDMRSTPSPRGGTGGGPYGLVGEYRDEIEGVVAATLEISADELQDGMEDGKTIAEIAEEKGVSSEDLTEAVAAKIDEIADRLVADGDLTSEQAEKIKSRADDIASRLVDGGRRFAPVPPGGDRG